MTKIFIEAKSKDTSEYHFIQTIINIISPEMEVDFIPMNGISNLFQEAILNQIKVAQEVGEQVIVFADADTIAKKYGYVKRKDINMQREKFSSRLGFILISAGCAIGLGNVWKFPYIVGQYGGAAFILLYLIFLRSFDLIPLLE